MASKYTFSLNRNLSDYTRSEFLFNQRGYLEIVYGEKAVYVFRMLRNSKETLSLPFILENNEVVIGASAPFGAIESTDTAPFEIFQNFMDEWYTVLAEKNVAKITWKHFPSVFNPELDAMTTQALLNLGFIIEGSAINFHIPRNQDFEGGLAEDTLRRLRKAETEGFGVDIHEKFALEFFFKDLVKWRSERNIKLNIDEDVLKKQLESLPDAYTLFSITHGNELIAFSIGVRVSDNVLYKYLPAHNPEYDNYSPVILLTKAMHQYARDKDFELLDLGIASEMKGEENYGLIRFKEKLGGKKSMKYTYIKELR